MPRVDLLALTPDDLASLSNRGTVKRAQKELETDTVTCQLNEVADGDLTFSWSDGIVCRFPAGRAIHDAVCSSGGLGITRHIIRSILYYQIAHSTPASVGEASADDQSPPSTVSPITAQAASHLAADVSDVQEHGETAVSLAGGWDPGTITDDSLIAHFKKPAIAKARKRFEDGVVVELTRGTKPVARFLDEGFTVRFLVPHDLRYVTADCAESLLTTWIPLAVWAFRELPADRMAGLISLQQSEMPVPTEILQQLRSLLLELCRDGIGNVADSWSQRLFRGEQALRQAGLVWLAELVVDLLHQNALYRQHDAQFDPEQLVHLTGELIARSQAIRTASPWIPQALIRGTKSDRAADISSGRMMGLGIGVRHTKRHTMLSAYLQDVDSGTVMAVERTFANPTPDSAELAPSFDDLANRALVRGVSLASLAAGQLLVKSAKRTPGGQLILPRTAANVTTHPQSFQWEQLKSPLAVENVAQLAARLESLPPSFLRPRRPTENLFVLSVKAVEAVSFVATEQRLTARLLDSQDCPVELVHQYSARGHAAFSTLLEALATKGDQVRFVCGHVGSARRSLEIRPVMVVLDDGESRYAVHAWIRGDDRQKDEPAPQGPSELNDVVVPAANLSIHDFMESLRDLTSDALMTGVGQTSPSQWNETIQTARRLGLIRIPSLLEPLERYLVSRANTLRWDPQPAAAELYRLCQICRVAEG